MKNLIRKKVGILALQGDFSAHAQAIDNAGGQAFLVKNSSDLEKVDGLIIPGGESTTMLKLIETENLKDALLNFGKSKPVFGTCAGAILMAREVCNPKQFSFNWLNIKIERNAYGRQIDSRIVMLSPESNFNNFFAFSFEAVFIRAPKMLSTGPEVNVLVRYEDYPVLVEQGLHMAATFHPELTSNLAIHRFFLNKINSPIHAEMT